MGRTGGSTDRTPPFDGTSGRPGGSSVMIALLVCVVALATVVGIVGAVTATVGFEGFDDGRVLTTEYIDEDVVFLASAGGVVVTSCGQDSSACQSAQEGQKAALNGPITQTNVAALPPDRAPLVVRFVEPQESVSVYVQEAGGVNGSQVARLVARDSSGRVVDDTTLEFDAGTGWHHLSVWPRSATVSEVTLTLSDAGAIEAGETPHNLFVVDELTVRRPDRPPWAPLDPWVFVLVGAVGGFTLFGGGLLTSKLVSRLRNGGRQDADQLPVPDLTYVPPSPVAGRPVAFDGTGSYDPDPDDEVVGYEWTVGDQGSTAPRFVHVFEEAGDHDVALAVTNTSRETGSRTETLTVDEASGELDLVELHPDAPGDDHENLDREYLVFENVGTGALDLSGWTIHDAAEGEDRVTEGEHTFEFPDGFRLDPGATVAVHTGTEPAGDGRFEGTSHDRHCFWGRDWAVWNNEADLVVVEDDRGDPVLGIRYERTGPGEYEREDLDPAILGDWFSGLGDEPGGGSGLGGLAATVLRGVVPSSRLRDIAAGFAFLRGPRRAIGSWAVAAAASFLTESTPLLTASAIALALSVAWSLLRRVRS